MSRSRLRQVARLEKRAVPYIKLMQEKREKSAASLRERAFVILANLSLLILFGDPRMGEPLSCAWLRCLESPTWKACREKHPDYIGQCGHDEGSPFDRWSAGLIAQYFRKYFLPELPGADETEKLNAVLAKAPAWLLWFTHGEVCGSVFGLKMPDFSSKSRFARPRIFSKLPDGPFEWRMLANSAEDEIYVMAREQKLKRSALLDKLTPRERMRAIRLRESG
jgi:hypothetical protein